MKKLLTLMLISFTYLAACQSAMKWPEGKKATIVLTYDDALPSHLNVAIPQLDKANLKGTFFLTIPASEKHITDWRNASKNGHELGNHSLYHPCLSTVFPADKHYQAENYSVGNIIREISVMNKILFAIDNKSTRTYAYPCGETAVGGKSYVDSLNHSGLIKYARSCGSYPIITEFSKLDYFQLPCMGFNSKSTGTDLINFVKSVQKVNGMAVIIFHGVGGDYLEVTADAHQQLVNYLKDNSKDIWVTTFEKATDYVSQNAK